MEGEHAERRKYGPQNGGSRQQEKPEGSAFSELEKYAVITAYLWLLFALFSLHRQLVQGLGVSVWHQGFAIVNALIFGKVILVGEALDIGKVLERRALVWVVIGKSLIFAILLLAFHITEEAIRSWFEGQPLSASFADFGGSLHARNLLRHFLRRANPFLRVLGGGSRPWWRRPLELVLSRRQQALSADRRLVLGTPCRETHGETLAAVVGLRWRHSIISSRAKSARRYGRLNHADRPAMPKARRNVAQ